MIAAPVNDSPSAEGSARVARARISLTLTTMKVANATPAFLQTVTLAFTWDGRQQDAPWPSDGQELTDVATGSYHLVCARWASRH